MRVWDVNPGFLNDKSLLGEHLEVHAVAAVITQRKKGYSRHPETLRWRGRLRGLFVRHGLLVEEMNLRGFNHRSPLDPMNGEPLSWPPEFIDQPAHQYGILAAKYKDRPAGRIPLPANISTLWARHKYSVMARDYQSYQKIGPLVAKRACDFDLLADRMTAFLRSPPSSGALKNTISHMWGYVSDFSDLNPDGAGSDELLAAIQDLARAYRVDYLVQSTALSELMFWCRFSLA